MAKEQVELVSRSQSIRQYLAEYPNASNKDAIAGLKKRGVEVKEGLVSNVKFNMAAKKNKGRVIRRAPEAKRSATPVQGTSRSQAVRDFLNSNPAATPKEIVAAMAQRGVKVSVALAAQVKYKRGAGKVKRAKRLVRRGGATVRVAAGGSLSAQQLVEAKQFADSVGGLQNAQRALELLQQLR